MSLGRLLVVTTVHTPDDARIRSKLIGTLSREWQVTYAARDPGPSDHENLTWHRLRGSRIRRWLGASWLLQKRRWDLVAVHDPELLPAALLRALGGGATLFDLHENLPAQIRTKEWIPSLLRPLLGGVAFLLLRLAERSMTVTMAESGYRGLFRRSHPVLANHLSSTDLPSCRPAAVPGFIAYLGDVSEQRGAHMAVVAAAGANLRLVMVGRVTPPELAHRLEEEAASLGVAIELVGYLPHAQALARIAAAGAGLSPLADIPNYRHSLPTKVLEYLALGLPVLASDLPGTRAVTGDRTGMIYVPPGDPVEWQRAGAMLAADPALRTATQAAAPEVRRDFSWSEDEVLSVYREAVRR